MDGESLILTVNKRRYSNGPESQTIASKLFNEHDQFQLKTALKESDRLGGMIRELNEIESKKNEVVSLEAGLLKWNHFYVIVECPVICIRIGKRRYGYILNQECAKRLRLPGGYHLYGDSHDYTPGPLVAIEGEL